MVVLTRFLALPRLPPWRFEWDGLGGGGSHPGGTMMVNIRSEQDLCYLSAGEAMRLFRARALSPVELLWALIELSEAAVAITTGRPCQSKLT